MCALVLNLSHRANKIYCLLRSSLSCFVAVRCSYTTVPCTATTDTRCEDVKRGRLNAGTIVAVVLAIVVVLMAAYAGWSYGRRHRSLNKELERGLEYTELLLGDVKV